MGEDYKMGLSAAIWEDLAEVKADKYTELILFTQLIKGNPYSSY